MDSKYVPGHGPIGARLLVLGDCPADNESMPFSTHRSGGKELTQLLFDAGESKNNVWLTNVVKYAIPPHTGVKKMPFSVRAKLAGIDMEQCLRELREEVASIQPNCILALSSGALWALNGKDNITRYRGSILHSFGSKFVSTYHPRDLSFQSTKPEFVGYYNKQIMACDFRRAVKQSQFKDYNPPTRYLEVCRNSAHFAEFRDRYRNKKRVSVDIESSGTCLPVCIGFSFDKTHGLTVPLWNCDGISTIPDSDMVQIWILIAQLLDEVPVIGQNFNYDRDKLKRLGFRINKLLSDVMLKAHAINPELPKGLAFNTSIYTEEPYYKDEGMYHGALHDLFIGCARDACVTLEICDNMDSDLDEIGQRPFFENFLMKLPDLYWSIEQQGFKVNPETRDKLVAKYIEWDERLRYELYQLTGTEINVYSPKQIPILLYDNFGLPRKQGTSEEVITELLNSPKVKDPVHRRVLELILEDRRVRKSISTYLMAMPDFDGRMRTTYFPCLDTGRTSTGQQDPPMRPSIEVVDETGKKKNKVLGIAFQTMTKHGDIGADIRSQYVPDEDDEVFINADSSQAEARVVWLLADDEEALRLVDEIDYHALTATWFFGGTELDYSKKALGYEHPIRFAGKTLRHAGHLGAGKRRASLEVNTQARKFKIDINISEAVAESALKIFHSKQPRIQQIFQYNVVECLKRDRTLIAPLPYGVEAPQGGRRQFYERWGEELFRQGFSYLPQRAVSDNTKNAALRIRAAIPHIKIVMEAHDALLFCVKKSKLGEYVPIIKREFERPIKFSNCSIPRRDLCIPCDVEIGTNYMEFKKFRDYVPYSDHIVEVPTRSITERFAVRGV